MIGSYPLSGLAIEKEAMIILLNQKITALYCRLNQEDDQNGDSNSIAHQKDLLQKYA
jgi:hypothetical protein